MKNKNGILILIVLGIAVMYYFVQKGKSSNQMETPPEDPPAEDPKAPEVPEAPKDPKAGQNIGTSTVKEEAKYYFNHPYQNPMLNPFIMPGFFLSQLKKKKK